MAYSPQELNSLTQRVMADPGVQRAWQEWNTYQQRAGTWSPGHSVSPYQINLERAMHQAGMPTNVRVSYQSGSPVLTNPGLPGWAYPLIIGGAALGGLGLAGALGGGAAAAGGAGSAATTSGAAGTLPAAGFIGGTSTVPTIAGSNLAAGTIAGGGGLAAAGGAAAGGSGAAAGGAAAGGSALDRTMNYLRAGLAGAGLVGAATQDRSNDLPPELQDILNLQKQRMQMQGPLYEAVTRLAYNRLPTNLTQGTGDDPISLAMQQMANKG